MNNLILLIQFHQRLADGYARLFNIAAGKLPEWENVLQLRCEHHMCKVYRYEQELEDLVNSKL